MALCEALYRRKCQSPLCWYQGGNKANILGPELIQKITKQIKVIGDKILTAQNRQKSYADNRHKPLEFSEGDHIFLKVTPTTGVDRIIRTKKLNPRYLGPFQILKRVSPVLFFHISQLKKYNPDESHVVQPKIVQLRSDLTYPALPIKIIERRNK
ncbi:hypothetical protein AAHE18_04G139400 [Arachis hypogaea]